MSSDNHIVAAPRFYQPWRNEVARLPRSRLAAALVAVLFLTFGCSIAFTQSTPIDIERSKLTVEVYKSGVFSGFAHDHQIAAPLGSGTLDPTARVVELRFDARKMKVVDPDVSASDRAQVQSTMLSDKVLDAEHFPEIAFTSRRITDATAGSYSVEGDLVLHGVSRPVTVPVALKGDHYVGSVKLKQSDFGIKPVKLFGGTVKVKDVIQIEFDIVPAAQRTAQ
jgi:hypothetical protein